MHIERVKRILDAIAYGSLFLDIAVAAINFIALRQNSSRLSAVQFWLSVGLSIEVIVTIFLFLVLLLLYHYNKLEWLMLIGKRVRKYKQHRRFQK
ncbi:MAG: hypothetical protein QXV13_00550 [Candidatus Micrarchaeaceae archaeon]